MTDPISDFLTRLRNASKARLDECVMPHSNLKESVAAILKHGLDRAPPAEDSAPPPLLAHANVRGGSYFDKEER